MWRPLSLLSAVALITLCVNFNPSTVAQSPSFPPYSAHDSIAQKQVAGFALKDGDRVVFFGDSITEQRLYTTYVEHYVLTHFPDRRITFINSGWGGDQVTGNDCGPCAGVGGLARIKRDVIDRRPTVVTLLFGMNDGHYQDFDPALLKTYEDGLSAIIRELKNHANARIYVMTPTVYDGTRHTPWSKTDRYNDVLDRYSEAAKQVAVREGLPVIDLHAVTTAALSQAKQADSAYTFLPDGVHPEPDGQLVMAAEILRAWGAPAPGVELIKQSVDAASKAQVISASAPLPWPSPLPSKVMRMVRPEVTRLGQVNLRIAGLPAGKYSVQVDGSEAAEFTAAELDAGIPISSFSARANELSRALAALVRQRSDIYFSRWRQIEVPLAAEYRSVPAALSSLDAVIDEMTRRARALGRPHEYSLVITRIQSAGQQ